MPPKRTDPGAALGLPRPRPLATLPKPGERKERKRPVQWEAIFQRTVAEFFEWALPQDVVWYHVPNGGFRKKAEAARLKAMGVKAGVHDFVFLWRGQYFELDLKVRGNTLSKEQREHAVRVTKAGGRVGSASDTLEDVCRQLDEWGIPHARIAGRL